MSVVYEIVNRITGKRYIGSTRDYKKRIIQHKVSLANNQHICVHLQRSYNRYGKVAFVSRVLHTRLSVEESLKIEQGYLDAMFDSGTLYNCSRWASGGDILSTHPQRSVIIQRIRRSLKNTIHRMSEDERLATYSRPGNLNGMYGKTHTREVRLNLSNRMKRQQYALGHRRSPETKNRLSLIARGRVGKLNPFFGRHHSLQTKEELRQINRGVLPPNTRPVLCEGKRFISLTEASRTLGVCVGTILFRIRSQTTRFLDYQYADDKSLTTIESRNVSRVRRKQSASETGEVSF